MSNIQSEILSQGIYFSVSAADKVAALIIEEENPKLNLRVFVTGGGCSGFQYGFTFDEKIQEDDTIIEQACSDGNSIVKLLVDSMSYQYLNDAEIDYVENIQGAQFVIRNPNAKTTCGCGSSFSMDDDDSDD
jgi:iron-sulfur cluster insertion protein